MTGTARPVRGLAIVDVEEIHPSPNNPRENLTGLDELAQSIYENGLIQPLIVQKIPGIDGFRVVAGHRRLAAAKLARIKELPCVIRKDLLPDDELLAMLVENGQRADLDPIEEARALRKLKNKGMTDQDIARKIGRSQGHVSARITLLSLPTEEQEQLRAGFGTITAAVKKARIESGRTRPGAAGKKSAAHLSTSHDLATKAANRCRSLGHKRGGGASVGGVACGECWETVIRANEREVLNDQSNERGRCVLCDTTQTTAVVA
ncbi:ParB/RepB/Spo0J family partition protein [Nocardioides jensenii]|uniref:ParB/RepB/Spo0J family partition protein n=1 Tax=Nocardioides jensenii TaxID=1843 RepID=UPI000831B56F|nr:ParB/RepB/Spo0J family partition protein [Nocardioides jensenii]